MAKSNVEQIKFAQSFLGKGGSIFRKYCGLPSGTAYCDAFVTYIFHKSGNASLFCGGKKQTYCPNTIRILQKELAEIPAYLAMPSDIILYDWDKNGTPNHIGFVRAKKSTSQIYTTEGNTSGGIVANMIRNVKYVQAIFRPHFRGSFSLKPLTVDGDCGYNTIASMQKLVGATVDAVLGKNTVKKVQAYCGVKQDGSWGAKTSKALQTKMAKAGYYTGKIDGEFGKQSVLGLQRFINGKVYAVKPSTEQKTPVTASKPTTAIKPSPMAEKAVKWAKSIAQSGKYTYKHWNNKDKKTKQCPICHKLTGKYKGWNCIGFVSAAYHHGAGLKAVECSCKGIGTDSFFTKVTLNSWEKRNGKGWKLITNGGKKGGADIPASKLIAGDVVICYDAKGKFHHVVLFTGNGRYIDCTNTSKNHIAERKYADLCKRYHVTRAFRYVSK